MAKQRAIIAARRHSAESQTPASTASPTRGRHISRERSQERSSTQVSDPSDKSSLRRDSRSASPAPIPDRRLARYRESPPSVDESSRGTVRPRQATPRPRRSRSRSFEEQSDNSHGARLGVKEKTFEASVLMPLTQGSEDPVDRSIDREEYQISQPALQPSHPHVRTGPLIDLSSSPAPSFMQDIDIKPTIWKDLSRPGTTANLIRLRTAFSDETERQGPASAYSMAVMHPSNRVQSESSSTQSVKSVRTMRCRSSPALIAGDFWAQLQYHHRSFLQHVDAGVAAHARGSTFYNALHACWTAPLRPPIGRARETAGGVHARAWLGGSSMASGTGLRVVLISGDPYWGHSSAPRSLF